MPASEHMVVIEKRRDIELRLLMSGETHENSRDSRPREAGKRRRAPARVETRPQSRAN
jgi:hypothetical protein